MSAGLDPEYPINSLSSSKPHFLDTDFMGRQEVIKIKHEETGLESNYCIGYF